MSERTKKNAHFPSLVEEAAARRALAQRLARFREKQELSQTYVAAQMKTSASVVSKLEGGGDVKLSTLQRYCAAINVPLNVAMLPSKEITGSRKSA